MLDKVKRVEIGIGKEFNISKDLTTSQMASLIKLLQDSQQAFAWYYTDMKGLDPSLCTHRIFINLECKLVRQPQRRINPTLKDIVKAELHKLLSAGFIYPISNSQWVSPLVIVSKKKGKWRLCVDYTDLNKATKKDHFPLPFIDQVLDNLARKRYLLFLDGFSGYNQI